MFNTHNIGSWLLSDIQLIDSNIRLFSDMLRDIDDLSNLIDFYHDKISAPSAMILNKGRLAVISPYVSV